MKGQFVNHSDIKRSRLPIKKICAGALALILVCTSLLTFSSCGAIEIDEINGTAAKEVLDIVIAQLDEASKYEARLDMNISVKLFFIPLYSIKAEECVTYKYDGEDQAYILDEEAKQKFEDEDMGDVFDMSDDEIIYVDGVCYVRNGTQKEKFYSSYSPIERSDFEKDVAEILAENAGTVSCFQDDDLYYFTVERTEDEESEETEIYTIYLDEDGRIQKITLEIKMTQFLCFTSKSVLTAEYFYENIDDIKAPADADKYILTDNYYW